MIAIQETHMKAIKELIHCDVANILFVHDKSRELMFYVSGKWFRIPIESGLPGYCVVTGETLNIPDAYDDHRFNR
jgi:hypothetical protein